VPRRRPIGKNGPQNRNAFGMNQSRRFAEFVDGLSQTLMAAEVKAYQTASNCRFTPLPSVNNPNNIPSPYANPFTVAPEYDDGACMTENQFEFHTERSDGNVHAVGFTTAWPPNKAIIGRPLSLYPGMDLDLNGLNEELGGPTFAAINSRSYHPVGSTSCWPMALSDSSRAPSTAWFGAPWGPSPAGK